MDRAEATGFGVAAVGHVALLAALTLGLANGIRPPVINQPIEVSFVDEVGLESQAPVASQEEPAPRLAEVEGPVEPVPPPEPEPAPKPQPKVAEPKPEPKVAEPDRPAKPKTKAAAPAKETPEPAKSKTRSDSRPTGRLSGLLKGVSDRESKSQSTEPPAKTAGPAVQSSLRAEVLRQLKPHWRSPTGADVELIRTIVEVRLARDGSIIGTPRVIEQTGLNASNRSQAGRHEEQAIKAVRLAAPFRLPAEFYDAWKVIRPAFDKRLSQ